MYLQTQLYPVQSYYSRFYLDYLVPLHLDHHCPGPASIAYMPKRCAAACRVAQGLAAGHLHVSWPLFWDPCQSSQQGSEQRRFRRTRLNGALVGCTCVGSFQGSWSFEGHFASMGISRGSHDSALRLWTLFCNSKSFLITTRPNTAPQRTKHPQHGYPKRPPPQQPSLRFPSAPGASSGGYAEALLEGKESSRPLEEQDSGNHPGISFF